MKLITNPPSVMIIANPQLHLMGELSSSRGRLSPDDDDDENDHT